MTNLQPTYEDRIEEATRTSRAIIRRADEHSVRTQEQIFSWPVLALQNKLKAEFEDGNGNAMLNSRAAQIFGVILVAVATWGFGVALYANL